MCINHSSLLLIQHHAGFELDSKPHLYIVGKISRKMFEQTNFGILQKVIMNTSVSIKFMVNHFLKFVCSKKSMSNCVCEVGSSSCSDLPVLSTIASRSPSLAFAIIVVVTWYSSSCTLPSPSSVHCCYNLST